MFRKLSLFIAATVAAVQAQELQIQIFDSVATGAAGSEIILNAMVYNLENEEISLEIIRLTNEIPPGWTSSLCFDVCAAPFVDTLRSNIAASDSQEFSFHFFTDIQPASGAALLKFRVLHGMHEESHLFAATSVVSTIEGGKMIAGNSFKLLPNYPNPFNNSTIISAELPLAGRVDLEIYDIAGRIVYRAQQRSAGPGTVRFIWAGTNSEGHTLPSGIYFYRLVYGLQPGVFESRTNKLTLIK